MQVYEIGHEDKEDGVIWLATDREVELVTREPGLYSRKIEVADDNPGVDIVVT